MYTKSPTCLGRASGRPLNEYSSEEEAASHAQHLAKSNRRQKMTPYACERCGRWHLAAAGRQTPSTTCRVCVGADGVPKETYRSEQEARRRARIIEKESGRTLSVYPCPGGGGWHLTKGERKPGGISRGRSRSKTSRRR